MGKTVSLSSWSLQFSGRDWCESSNHTNKLTTVGLLWRKGLGAERKYWQVGGEGREWLLSDLRSGRCVGVTWRKFGCGKENCTGGNDKVGGNIYIQGTERRLMWLEHRVCVCWRVGCGTKCSRRSGRLPQSSQCRLHWGSCHSSQSSDVPERYWRYVNMTWLELHFEKMIVLCMDSLL